MSIKVYEYKGCDTCRKALKFLEGKKIVYEKIPIRETPPSKSEIQLMLKYLGGEIKRLFNTSGGDYREMKISEKLPKLTEAQVADMLSKNGNLVKRPFVLSDKFGMTGFKEEEWKKVFK